MCGILGVCQFENKAPADGARVAQALTTLTQRGPDGEGIWESERVLLGHTRLSILDTSDQAQQPMRSADGRYVLVFNGEVYNYRELHEQYLPGMHFHSTGDTIVLLHLLIRYGVDILKALNGFFALAFYDSHEDRLVLARDRMGIKPLHLYRDDFRLLFASEYKALLEFGMPKALNYQALTGYLQLGYLPLNQGALKGVGQLEQGTCLVIDRDGINQKAFVGVTPLISSIRKSVSHQEGKEEVIRLLDASVRRRLIADVPLGAFLSGGTDSSVIVALASRYKEDLQTFSIGYADHPFFDETQYAELVARKFHTRHTTFKLTNEELLADLDDILDYIDQPFADSSVIPTYILSKRVAASMKVALSGDGADELFGGYYKHWALNYSLGASLSKSFVRLAGLVTPALPQSRSGRLPNLIRRIDKLARILGLPPRERYLYLASLTPSAEVQKLMIHDLAEADFSALKLPDNPGLNDFLLADQKLVLPGDMLTKVDLMSMANGLEVRVPFLDHEVVDFVNELPSGYKVSGRKRKLILQDAFRQVLPAELYHRPKKGFEIPLLDWMRKELCPRLDEVVFNRDLLESQGIFQTEEVMRLREKLFSNNPGDVHGILWTLLIFQNWYRRYVTS